MPRVRVKFHKSTFVRRSDGAQRAIARERDFSCVAVELIRGRWKKNQSCRAAAPVRVYLGHSMRKYQLDMEKAIL